MVRVNLLPNKKENRNARRDPAQIWMVAVGALVLFELLGIFFVHKAKADELASVKSDNAKVQRSIDEIKSQTAAHAEVKEKLKALKSLEEAITKLQTARTGPTGTLLEVSKVLTPGAMPTVDHDKLEQLRRDNPTAAPSLNWDPKRLWLTQFSENARVVRIAGLARDGEDVSEFIRRLSVSDYFTDVRLLPATKMTDPTTRIELVQFDLSAKVKY
jgi:type IV pilus assembly protein PilN